MVAFAAYYFMILTARYILVSTGKEVISHGALVLRHGRISDIGQTDKILRKHPSHIIFDLGNCVIMPGLVNTHAHIELPFLLNTIKSSDYSKWIVNLIRAKKCLTNTDYATAAEQNIRELIQCGTTTVGDISTHGISGVLLKKSGLRAVVYQEIINMMPSVKWRASRMQFPLLRGSTLIKNGLSPHTPFTVSEAVLLDVLCYSAKHNIPLAMHVAESKEETALLRGNKGGLNTIYELAGWNIDWAPHAQSSFEYLHRLGLLSPRLMAVHAVHVTDREISLMQRSKSTIAHCPRSNRNLAVGKMPLKKFLDAKLTVGLGTDSLASVHNLNMWDEMRSAYHMHKNDGVTPEDIFYLATMGGASALGLGEETGSISPGKRADMIAIFLPKKTTGNLYSDLLRETKSCIMNIVNGKMLRLTPNASTFCKQTAPEGIHEHFYKG